MKTRLLLAFAMVLSVTCFAQTDTIYTNNEKIACVAESTSFKRVKGVDDFENVTITQVEGEVRGLFKVGEVSSKAKGTTTLSNQERVKERAYRKMKMIAAMMGANAIYITSQRSEGNRGGGKHQAGSPAVTNITGVAYSNYLPSIDEFKSIVKDKKSFIAVEKAKLWSSASDLNRSILQNEFTINEIRNENGIIMINGVLQGEPNYKNFRIVSFDKDYFNVYYEDKSSSYSIKVKI